MGQPWLDHRGDTVVVGQRIVCCLRAQLQLVRRCVWSDRRRRGDADVVLCFGVCGDLGRRDQFRARTTNGARHHDRPDQTDGRARRVLRGHSWPARLAVETFMTQLS